MKPLTLEETKLKEEMKERCLAKGQYIDEKAKDKFKMLCHLEDFEIQYWELDEENKRLKERIEYLERSNNRREDTILEQRQKISDLEDNWNKLREYLFDIRKRGFALQNLANVTKNTEPNIAILIIINKMQEMEKNYGDVENNT